MKKEEEENEAKEVNEVKKKKKKGRSERVQNSTLLRSNNLSCKLCLGSSPKCTYTRINRHK